MPDKQNRKLAAILFADIAGYTALMQQDERMASVLLRRFQKKMKEKVAAHGGRIVNFYGDGALSIFEKPIDAVQSAMELQHEFSIEPPVPVRMGVHYGSVVFEEGKVYGHSVNLASRIESVGMPQAVLLSKAIRDGVEGYPQISVSYVGAFRFKNVKESTELYAVANKGYTVPQKIEINEKLKIPGKKSGLLKWLLPFILALLGIIGIQFWGMNGNGQKEINTELKKVSIAVLPFEDRSPNKNQAYFSDGIAEEILNTLGQLRSLKVAGRTSSFSFKGKEMTISEIGHALGVNHVLEGSIVKYDNKVRITVQLIKVEDGFHVWSRKFEENFDDIFRIQDEVALNVSEALLKKLAPEQIAQLKNDSNKNSGAYELYLKAKHHHREKYAKDFKIEGFKICENLFLQAIELDSTFGLAHAGLADLYDTYLNMGAPTKDTIEIEKYNQLRIRHSENALKQIPKSSYANEVKGHIMLNGQNDLEQAFSYFSKAFELNSNNSSALIGIAEVYLYKSLVDDALKLNKKALEIDPLRSWHYSYKGYTHGLVGDFESAIDASEYALKIDSNELMTRYELAEFYAVGDRKGEALQIYQSIQQSNPSFFEWDPYHKKMVAILNNKSINNSEVISIPNEHFFQYYLQRNNLLLFLNKDFSFFQKQFKEQWEIWKNRTEYKNYCSYIHFVEHPMYEDFRNQLWFQDILKIEKEKFEQFFNTYPRAEEILNN